MLNQVAPDILDSEIYSFASKFSNQVLRISKEADKPFVVYFVGMIGSGKTTTAKFISTHYNLVRVSTDEVRDFLEENGFSRERSFDVAEVVAERILQQGYGIVFDADLVDQYFQDHVIALSKKVGVLTLLLQIQTPESLILKRLRADNSDRVYKGKIAIHDYTHRKPKFENLSIQPDVIIDGSADFEEQMKHTIQIIDKKLAITRS